MSEQTIYVVGYSKKSHIEDPENEYFRYFKIGIATNVKNRLSTLSSGTPHNLHLITTLESDDPKTVENFLHRIAKISYETGEWFRYNPNIINSLIAIDELNEDVAKTAYIEQFRKDFHVSLYVLVGRARNGELETPEVVL